MQTQSNISKVTKLDNSKAGIRVSMLLTQSYRMFIISYDLQDTYSELTFLWPCFLIQGLGNTDRKWDGILETPGQF